MKSIPLVLPAIIVLLSSCRSAPVIDSARAPANFSQPTVEQGEVWTAAEDAIAEQITAETRAIALENRVAGQPLRRDAHPKHHGCVQAYWSNQGSQLPANARYGVFAEAGPSPAWLRLSNGDPKGFANADAVKDVRGFALKIMNATGTPKGSQDFVAMTSPRFFSRDGEDYLNLFHALRGGTLALAWYAARNWTNISIVRAAQVRIANPLTTDFFVPVPTKLGRDHMRMHFRPCANPAARSVRAREDRHDYLREVLVESLKKEGACFDVLVQINRDPSQNPLENTTLEWNTDLSPWIPAGKVEIPAQTGFDTPERMAFCENLSFNPWNAHPELRPMGQINRIRKIVYDEVSRLRHGENQIPEIEPRDHRACEGDTKPLCQ